jgi:diphthamide biosynthesis methyltransferase
MNHYEVIVGNLGTVYGDSDAKEASRVYKEYEQQSREGYGRAAYEDVWLIVNGEPMLAYMGSETPYEDRN